VGKGGVLASAMVSSSLSTRWAPPLPPSHANSRFLALLAGPTAPLPPVRALHSAFILLHIHRAIPRSSTKEWNSGATQVKAQGSCGRLLGPPLPLLWPALLACRGNTPSEQPDPGTRERAGHVAPRDPQGRAGGPGPCAPGAETGQPPRHQHQHQRCRGGTRGGGVARSDSKMRWRHSPGQGLGLSRALRNLWGPLRSQGGGGGFGGQGGCRRARGQGGGALGGGVLRVLLFHDPAQQAPCPRGTTGARPDQPPAVPGAPRLSLLLYQGRPTVRPT